MIVIAPINVGTVLMLILIFFSSNSLAHQLVNKKLCIIIVFAIVPTGHNLPSILILY